MLDEATSTAEQAYTPSAYVSVRDDSTLIAEVLPPNNYRYTDIAVSDGEIYLLRTKVTNVTDTDKANGLLGVIEKHSLESNGLGGWKIGPTQLTINGNYKAIDYVKSQSNRWGLIGLGVDKDGRGAVLTNIEGRAVALANYSEVENAQTDDVVGIDASNGTWNGALKLILRRNFGDGAHTEYSVAMRTDANPAITWSAPQGGLNYVGAISEKNGSLYTVRIYMAGKFIRLDTATWASQIETILSADGKLSYDAHGYQFEYHTTQLAPRAMDYQDRLGRFVTLETAVTSTGSHQVVVSVPASKINL
jgi:hypothetical protein